MISKIKTQKQILAKLGIEELNDMQREAQSGIHANKEVILLSPTGTGKTVAFLLPLIAELNPDIEEIQLLILAPSRELAIQIEKVCREMGTGYKVNAFYGGRNFTKDKLELKQRPSILIGTPGRIADHLRRETFSSDFIKTIVLDEFDKSLEVGFENEMIQIIDDIPKLKKKVLTSATDDIDIPPFMELVNPHVIDYLHLKSSHLSLKTIISPTKDKLETLVDALHHLGNQSGIVFINYKDSINRVSEYLEEEGIAHGIFYGGMEQIDRERALIKFRNGTHKLILATDLASRGLDIPELNYIIHYHLPYKEQAFIHRNGRTARMHSEGTAYILKWKDEILPDFIKTTEVENLSSSKNSKSSEWVTLFISGGRKDKISKGDIAGLLYKQGKLDKGQVGNIELKRDCAFVAVEKSKLNDLLPLINNTRLKKKKVRVKVV